MPLSKPTAAASTGSATVASQTVPLWSPGPPKERLRIGLVGTGYIAEFHARALRAIGDVELVAVADQSPLRAAAFARDNGIAHACGSLTEMLRGDLLDAVHILTPPDTHADIAREAVEADVDVLLEKPLDITPHKALAPLRIGRAAGRDAGGQPQFSVQRALRAGCGKTSAPGGWGRWIR